MEVRLSVNMKSVKDVVLSQWDKYAEDGVEKSEFNPKQEGNEVWLDIIANGEVIGVCKVSSLQVSMVCIHPYILSKHRYKFKSAVRAVLSFLLELGPIHKVVAIIGVQHSYVIKTAMNIGARPEGLITEGYLKDGHFWDQVILGIKKGELK